MTISTVGSLTNLESRKTVNFYQKNIHQILFPTHTHPCTDTAHSHTSHTHIQSHSHTHTHSHTSHSHTVTHTHTVTHHTHKLHKNVSLVVRKSNGFLYDVLRELGTGLCSDYDGSHFLQFLRQRRAQILQNRFHGWFGRLGSALVGT